MIAYFDSSHDMPEEIIVAAGFVPYKILGDVHESTGPADKYLFETFCPSARSILTEALNSSGEWEGIVVAHGCDATHRHFDIWRARGAIANIEHPELGKLEMIRVPWKINNRETPMKYAPLLGEHNQYVFGELLGLSDEELADLNDKEIIS